MGFSYVVRSSLSNKFSLESAVEVLGILYYCSVFKLFSFKPNFSEHLDLKLNSLFEIDVLSVSDIFFFL